MTAANQQRRSSARRERNQDRASTATRPDPVDDDVVRQPPHDLAAEQALLGACLLGKPELVTETRAALPDGRDYFYDPRHGVIWRLICSLADQDITPDPVTIADAARTGREVWRDPEASLYVHQLYADAPLVTHLAEHCRIVSRYAVTRQLDVLATRMRQAVQIGDHDRLLELAGTLRDDIDEALAGIDPTSKNPLPVLTLKELRAEVGTNPVTYLLEPVWPGDAYGVIAAEDKAGKSWAVIDMALSVAVGGVWMRQFHCLDSGPVLLFAGEGGQRNLLRRIDAVAEHYGIDTDAIDFEVCPRVPHLTDPRHLDLVARYLERPRRLVIIDPLYLAARGANGADLYAMGEHLEGIQHVCQQAGAALVVVTHFNKTGVERNGKNRITGVGPAAWGRVLATAAVESREAYEGRTRVVLNWDFIGGEIPDTELHVRRTVWAEDPTDLASPMHYEIERVDPDELKVVHGTAPSHARVLAVLRAAPGPLTVQDLGDRLAADGHPLKKRTIQEALATIAEHIDSREIDSRGTREFWIRGRV